MKLTRRELAAVLASGSALAQAQTETPTAPDDLKTARARVKANGELLAAQRVPMAVEPAFQFKA